MKKIEMEIVDAIRNKKELSTGNGRDAIALYKNSTVIYRLWNNAIILRTTDGFFFTFASYMTNTTKSRINSILKDFIPCFSGVYQKDFELYYKDEKIDASAVYLVKQDDKIEKTNYEHISNVLN